MTIHEITEFIESLQGVLTVKATSGDGSPEIVWGDLFFYYAPDGVAPPGQPFATIVTKDYPGEPSSGLGAGVFRVNVDARRRDQDLCQDPTEQDTVIPHPVYGHLGWVSVVHPGPGSLRALEVLLRDAHAAAQRRWHRRHG